MAASTVSRGHDSGDVGFTGTVKNVVFDLKPEPLEAEVALHEHAALHAVATGVAG